MQSVTRPADRERETGFEPALEPITAEAPRLFGVAVLVRLVLAAQAENNR
jgi:hypothetical protein